MSVSYYKTNSISVHGNCVPIMHMTKWGSILANRVLTAIVIKDKLLL